MGTVLFIAGEIQFFFLMINYMYTVSEEIKRGVKIIVVKAIGEQSEEDLRSFKEFLKNMYSTYCTEEHSSIGIVWELTEAEMIPFLSIYDLANIFYEMRDATRTKMLGCSFVINNWILQESVSKITTLFNVREDKPIAFVNNNEDAYQFLVDLKNT